MHFHPRWKCWSRDSAVWQGLLPSCRHIENRENLGDEVATVVMRFSVKKKAGWPKAPRDFPPRKDGIPHPLSGSLGTPLPLPQSLYGRTYVR